MPELSRSLTILCSWKGLGTQVGKKSPEILE